MKRSARSATGSRCPTATWCGSAPCSGPIRAHRSMPLVLVGPTAQWAHELQGVKLTGAVSDDELAAIYTGAHALVFPSDDEGFGLPPVEALACGTPVAACDVPALREVLGGLVTLSSVDDLDALVRSAEALRRPAAPPPGWSWSDAASATWAVYMDAHAAPAPTRRRRVSHPDQGAQAGGHRPQGAARRRAPGAEAQRPA